jgi:hypothetical protein
VTGLSGGHGKYLYFWLVSIAVVIVSFVHSYMMIALTGLAG